MPMNDNHNPCRGCRGKEMARRELLVLAGVAAGAVVALVALPACGPATGSPPTGMVSAGNVSGLAVGSLQVMSNVAVGRDAGGLYAMSAVCTHAGCLLNDRATTVTAGLSCPCHGSTFDGNGAVTAGPARTPLQHYAVTVSADGSVVVDGSQPVSAATRTPVS